jgi:hypothetical protein
MRTSVQCPTTTALIAVNIKDDAKSVSQGWGRSLSLQCPHCGERHVVRYRDVYIEGVLSGFQGDLDRLLKIAT